MDMGTDVGVLAREFFPGGVLVEETHRQIPAALTRTAELVADPTVPAILKEPLCGKAFLSGLM